MKKCLILFILVLFVSAVQAQITFNQRTPDTLLTNDSPDEVVFFDSILDVWIDGKAGYYETECYEECNPVTGQTRTVQIERWHPPTQGYWKTVTKHFVRVNGVVQEATDDVLEKVFVSCNAASKEFDRYKRNSGLMSFGGVLALIGAGMIWIPIKTDVDLSYFSETYWLSAIGLVGVGGALFIAGSKGAYNRRSKAIKVFQGNLCSARVGRGKLRSNILLNPSSKTPIFGLKLSF